MNVSIMPGVIVGDGCWIGPGVVLGRNLDPGQRVFVKQELVIK